MFLAHATASGGAALMEAALSQASLACLWDHRVAGRVLFPAAAMLEAAAAGMATMLPGLHAMTAVGSALTGVSIPASLVLPGAAQGAGLLMLVVRLDARSGAISVESVSAASGTQVHMRAAVTCVQRSTAPSAKPGMRHAQLACAQLIADAAHPRNAAAPAAVAVANVVQDPRQQQGDQYLVHPAVIDNATQAGAAFARPADTPGVRQVTRVPAGLGAFAVSGRVRDASNHASAAFVGLLEDDSAVNDYSLISSGSSAAGMGISGMLFKPVSGGMPRAAAGAAADAPFGAADALYGITWTVQRPVIAPDGAQWRKSSNSMRWKTVSAGGTASVTVRLSSSTGRAGDTVKGLASGLRFVQTQAGASSASAEAIMLHTMGPTDAGQVARTGHNSMAVAEAGAAGLLRVAAQEYPAATWQHYSQQEVLSGPSLETKRSADAFGINNSSGAWLLPQMQRAAPAHEASNVPSLAARSAIVTGGLGDIGSLVALLVSVSSPDAHLHLISRTGRSVKPLPAALLHASRLVSIVRCDASTRDEVAALAAHARRSAHPLGAVLHAGGALRDGLLPKQASINTQRAPTPTRLLQQSASQGLRICPLSACNQRAAHTTSSLLQTLGGLRATVAPKLTAAQALGAACAGEPIARWALFSSLSALLGTPGQANYAAANAQLNAWADAQQHTGALPCRPGQCPSC